SRSARAPRLRFGTNYRSRLAAQPLAAHQAQADQRGTEQRRGGRLRSKARRKRCRRKGAAGGSGNGVRETGSVHLERCTRKRANIGETQRDGFGGDTGEVQECRGKSHFVAGRGAVVERQRGARILTGQLAGAATAERPRKKVGIVRVPQNR